MSPLPTNTWVMINLKFAKNNRPPGGFVDLDETLPCQNKNIHYYAYNYYYLFLPHMKMVLKIASAEK